MQVNYCLNIDLTFLINLNCSLTDTDKLGSFFSARRNEEEEPILL